jgi:pimeloyl-ACP methyl ester carboxylesterase
MTTKTIKTNSGTTISYVDEGQGKPVVLVHGFLGDHHYWDHVVAPLAKQYLVIAIDLPGHGESSLSDQTTTIEDYADEIASFLKQLQLEKVSLIGHSLGGYIVMAFAEKYADLLDRFALIHSTALPDTEEAKAGRVAGMEKIREEGLYDFVNNLIPKLFAPANLAEHEQIAREIGHKTSINGALAALESMRNRPDRVSVLEKSNVPVLILAGGEDGVVPSKRAFISNGKHIKQVLLSEVGHMAMYEAPERLVDELRQFMDR